MRPLVAVPASSWWFWLLSLNNVRVSCPPPWGSVGAPPSLGFSRQEHWSGGYYPIAAAAAAASLQSCPTLWDPIDGSPPGSPIPGILQARTLEWVAISFSNAWKWKVKVKSLSCVWLLATPLSLYCSWKMLQVGSHLQSASCLEKWNFPGFLRVLGKSPTSPPPYGYPHNQEN